MTPSQSPPPGSRAASWLVGTGVLLFVLSPVVLFGGFAWIQEHHYGDGTGDLLTPFVWAGLAVLLGVVLVVVGLASGAEADRSATANAADTGARVRYDGQQEGPLEGDPPAPRGLP